MPAWNPSFDVTPSGLISGLITELGVVPFDPSRGLIPIAEYLLGPQHAGALGPDLAFRCQNSCRPLPSTSNGEIILLIQFDLANRLGLG